jgi:hypothetical protein
LAAIEDRLAELMDDRDFHHIDTHLRRFNIFEAMGAVRGELRHSNFLSFILSPTRSHGIGSSLLLQFIRAAIAKQPATVRIVRSIELMVADLESAVLYRERDNIDLLIELKQLNLVVLVENKIDASVGDGQLQRYKKIIEARYPDFRHLFILLTPGGTEPDDENYVALSYSEVADLIESAVDRDKFIGSDVSLILEHYVQMLRRHIVQDEQLADLARQLYERHKEAFDFVIEQRPQPDNLLEEVRDLLEVNTELAIDRHAPMILRFAPKEWASIPEFNSCPEPRWTHTKRNLIFEVKANRDTDRIIVALISGPADSGLRLKIYDFATSQPKLFAGLVKPMGAKTATIFSKELLSAKAADSMDSDEKRDALKKAWGEFLTSDFVAITSALALLSGKSSDLVSATL